MSEIIATTSGTTLNKPSKLILSVSLLAVGLIVGLPAYLNLSPSMTWLYRIGTPLVLFLLILLIRWREGWQPYRSVMISLFGVSLGIGLAWVIGEGMRAEDIHVVFEKDTLAISAERVESGSSPKTRLHHMEIDYGDFYRTLYIPFPLKADEIRAVYRQGFLTVTIPKRQETGPKVVEVNIR